MGIAMGIELEGWSMGRLYCLFPQHLWVALVGRQ